MKLLSHGPEPCASANSATSATARVIITQFHENVKRFLKIFHKNIFAFFVDKIAPKNYTKSVNKEVMFLRITHEADYAVRIVYTLMKSSETTVPASKLAEGSGVTLRFTLKILRKLASSGIVKAQKGANGGYALALNLADISLGLIIESIDGPFELNHCLSDEFDCTRVKDKSFCQFHHVFNDLTAKLKAELYGITMDQF